MKVNTQKSFQTKTSGDFKTLHYNIQDEDKGMFIDLVRNKIYKNPIGSIAREVSSNGRDANREALCRDTLESKGLRKDYLEMLEVYMRELFEKEMAEEDAIAREFTFSETYCTCKDGEFTCPNLKKGKCIAQNQKKVEPIEIIINDSPWFEGEKTIIFKDNGVGISPDRMADVFVNYGKSTKRGTDGQTGGFGLGAKTPFSYTDSFAISTRYDGIKYTYMTASEEGKPGQMYEIQQEPTSERNGTEIIVPMKENDRNIFEKEVFRATAFWTVRPKLVNFNSKFDYKVLNEHEGVKIISNNYITEDGYERHLVTGYNLVIDGIIYDLDSSLIEEDLNQRAIVLITFDTGDLTLTANREAVQYDEKTSGRIKSKLASLKKHYEAKLTKHLDEQPNYLQACITAYNIKNNSGESTSIPFLKEVLNLHKNIYFYNKKEIDWKISSVITQANITSWTNGGRQKIGSDLNSFSNIFNTKRVILRDTVRLSYQRNETLFNENEEGYLFIEPINNNLINFSKLTFNQKKCYAKAMRQLLTELKALKDMGVKYTLYSDVEKAKAIRVNKTVKSKQIKCRIFANDIKDENSTCNKDLWNDNESIVAYENRMEYGKYEIHGLNMVDSSTVVYMTVDTLKDVVDNSARRRNRWRYEAEDCFLNSPMRFRISIVLELGYTLVVTSHKFAKNFKGFKHFDDIVDCPAYNDIVKKMVLKTQFDGFEKRSDVENLKKYTFKDQTINDTIAYLNSIPKRDDTYIPEEYLKMYSLNKEKEMKKYNTFIENILKSYPLLVHISSYYERQRGYRKCDFQQYIDLMDARPVVVETEELKKVA